MDRLNRDGWDIHVTTSTRDLGKAATVEAPSTARNRQQHLVLAIEMRDGHHFLSTVNPRFARELNNQLNSISEVSHHSWFVTEDSWFDNMPRVRSLRGRRVDTATYLEKTRAMTPFTL